MKFVESKEAFYYIFTEILPVPEVIEGVFSSAGAAMNDKVVRLTKNVFGWTIEEHSFLLKEGPWVATHLTGGLMFSLAFPGAVQVPMTLKISMPLSGTLLYGVRQNYYYNKPKAVKSLLGKDLQDNCLAGAVMDALYGAIMSAPYAFITGNPAFMGYSALQQGLMGRVSCFSSLGVSDKNTKLANTIANTVVAGGLLTGYTQGILSFSSDTFEEVLYSVNNIATTASLVAFGHNMAKGISGWAVDYMYPEEKEFWFDILDKSNVDRVSSSLEHHSVVVKSDSNITIDAELG